MAEKTYVCGYNHCQKHEKIPASEAVIVGGRRYHRECADIRIKIIEIRNLYIENIDKNVNFPELAGVINRIIFEKQTDVNYMLFAMKNIIRRKLRIKSPYTLYYIAENKQIYEMWKKSIEKSGD